MDRAQVPEWIAEQNALVLGDEPCSHFLLVNVANEDIIGSYPVPADAERILARIADLPDELPTGHQAIKLIAVGKSGSLRATVTMQMQGRSAGAKRATDDMIQHARAMNATLGGMESSMASMAARAQAADQSAAASEARAREMQNAQFELVQFCQKMVLERQAEQAKLEEAKARSETFKMLGAQAAPYVGPLMNVAL